MWYQVLHYSSVLITDSASYSSLRNSACLIIFTFIYIMIIFVLLGIVHSAGVKVEGKIHKCTKIVILLEMGKIFIDDPKI